MSPAKHHYVPQCLLRQFAIGSKKRQVYVFDKHTDSQFLSAIKDVACETGFNTVIVDGERKSFEGFFQQFDDALAAFLAALEANPNLVELNPAHLIRLPLIVACQITRTKIARTTIHSFATQMNARLEESGIGPVQNPIPIPTEEDLKRIAAQGLADSTRLGAILAEKHPILLEIGDGPLWLSDSPVVVQNSFPYGELGLKSLGIEVYLPLSPSRVLAFLCPSIEKKTLQLLTGHATEEVKAGYAHLYKAIQTGTTQCVPFITAGFLNTLQVQSSQRFLYSPTKTFDLALSLLHRRTDLRDVQSRLTVGEMGSAPPPCPFMPIGLWLVLEGNRDHCMIPIARLHDGTYPLVLTSGHPSAQHDVLACGDLSVVRLYESGAERLGMRDVAISLSPAPDGLILTVTHRDPGLHNVMTTVASKEQRSGE
jgi:hypothetical protein